MANVEGTHPNDDSEKLNLGLEYGWREIFFARVGYGVEYNLTTIAYGGGLKFKIGKSNLIFDYVLAPFSDLGNIHFFAIGLEFKKMS
jgi:hypothetical protein